MVNNNIDLMALNKPRPTMDSGKASTASMLSAQFSKLYDSVKQTGQRAARATGNQESHNKEQLRLLEQELKNELKQSYHEKLNAILYDANDQQMKDLGWLGMYSIVVYIYIISLMAHEIFDIYRQRQQWAFTFSMVDFTQSNPSSNAMDLFMVVRIIIQVFFILMGFNGMRNYIRSAPLCNRQPVKTTIVKLFMIVIMWIVAEHMYRYTTHYRKFDPQNLQLQEFSCMHGSNSLNTNNGCRITNCAYVDKKNPHHIYYVNSHGSVCPNTVHYINTGRTLIQDHYKEESSVAMFRIVTLVLSMIAMIMQ